jgi:MFS family permease
MRWRILALLFLARIGTGLQFQTLGSVGDDLVVAFGLDFATIGLLIGLFMAPGLFLALPAGFLGGFASDRVLAVTGLMAMAIGGFVSGVATESWFVGLGRLVAGIGFLLINLYFTKMVADWFVGQEIATAMSILVTSWPIGIAMGQIGHAWLAQSFGWTVPFHVASIYCLASALCVLLLYRAPRATETGATASLIGLSGKEWRLIFCAGGAWGVYNAGYVVYLSFGPGVLEAQGYSVLSAAGTLSLASWLMIVSFALCGYIADCFGRRNTILAICMLSAIFSLFLLGVPGAGLASSFLFGLVGFAPAGLIMALAGEALRPAQRAFGMGIFFTIYYAIMVAVPPAAGAILDATGQPQGPIWLAMILFASVVPFAVAFKFFKADPDMVAQRTA